MVGILCIIGVLMVFSSSGIDQSNQNLITKHLMWLGVGMVALVVMSNVPHQQLRKISVPLLGVSAVLLMGVPNSFTPISSTADTPNSGTDILRNCW